MISLKTKKRVFKFSIYKCNFKTNRFTFFNKHFKHEFRTLVLNF